MYRRAMNSARLVGLGLVTFVTLAALGACGSDDAGGVDTGDGGDGTNEGGLPEGALPDGFVPPTRSEFGLDTRPANPTCKAPARPPTTAPVKLERVFDAATLNLPMMIAQAPGDKTRWFVAQRNGSIVKFDVANPATVTPVGTLNAVSGCTINQAGEGGFLGMAFHPKFATNGKVYVSWTVTDGACGANGGSPLNVNMYSTIGVLHSPDNGNSFDTYETIVPAFPQPASNHNGGGITFGKDGLLYVSFGDGGGGDDPFIHGQSTATMFSKVLRIDVDNPAGGLKYGIPATNPFKNGGGEPATFAYGFRNPFRISIDRETNELWVADVGQNKWEEVNAKVKIGANYGWPCREGLHDYITTAPKCPSNTGSTDPQIEHEHIPVNQRSITGGVVYRGTAIPGFVGSYVYGDYKTLETFTISFDPGTGEAKSTKVDVPAAPAVNWVSFAEDNDGEVYGVALNQSQIYKLLPAAAQGPDTFPKRLSQTGCVDPADAKKPAAGLVAYGVTAALWSDGALKDRWLAIPDGTKITVKDADGDFDFPAGSVLVKTFSLGGKRIETRLFMRHDDGAWAGYTYEWLDDQSDAVLLPAGKVKTIGAQTWTYPSRSDCVSCHTEAAGRSLGLELGQLNAEFTYPTTNRLSNQLKTLDHIGMFDKPLGKPVGQIVAYPDPYGTAGNAEQRARAYVHSNCSNCHRPQGGGRGAMDLRWGTAFADTKTCNVDPEAGDLGIGGAKLIVPGNPALSLVSIRPHSPAANRMPPLATSVVDTAGVKVVDDWIRALGVCP